MLIFLVNLHFAVLNEIYICFTNFPFTYKSVFVDGYFPEGIINE